LSHEGLEMRASRPRSQPLPASSARHRIRQPGARALARISRAVHPENALGRICRNNVIAATGVAA